MLTQQDGSDLAEYCRASLERLCHCIFYQLRQQLTPGSTGCIMDPNYRNPMTEEFNAGYSWSLSPTAVVEADYIHFLSLHENKTININPNLPINGDPNQGFARPLSAGICCQRCAGFGQRT